MGNHDPKAWEQGDQIQKAQEEMTFVSLHHHSTFSYKDGFGTPEQHIVRAAELGMTAMALTEHGNVTSHPQLEQAGKKHGVKPIFGCEFYCGEVGEGATQKKNHLSVLAMDVRGYRNLLRIVSESWAEGFYYEPTVSGAMLAEHGDGLVVTSGCSGSLLATSLVGGKNIDPSEASMERARRVARRFKSVLGDRYYIEVQAFPELRNTCNINAGLAELSKELGIPLVATLDVHYTRPDESFMQQILHNVRGGFRKTMEELDQAWGYDIKLAPLTDADVFKRLVATGLSPLQASGAIRASREIADRCTVELPKVENLRYPLPGGFDDPVALFRRWINEGWKYRGFNRLPPEERRRYIDRCKYEMSLIEQKEFVDYFLVISDAVKFAKDNGVPVGPARGSAAASLVCYLLRITEVDPMHFPTLIFERFIDLNRHDLPDIDLDFDDERRYMVRDYLVSKYGKDRVGNIGTFTRYKGKNSIDDVARALRIPSSAAEELKGLAIERSSGDLRASDTLRDTIEMFPRAQEIVDEYPELLHALELEGNVRGMSVHAAGLVIANEALSNFCAVYTREDSSGEKAEVVSLDKWGAEYLNVMKFDALGLKTMGMIRIALEEIGMTLRELYSVPLDDEDTINGFREGDVVGVFQFDGRAMRSVNTGVVPDTFMEICDCNALARPGPLHSGATADYIDAKHGRKAPVHYHPLVDDITRHTQFQVVYQEQILQIVRQLGRFSWEEAARIRKIISKKRGETEFRTMRQKFLDGAAEEGMSEEEADKVFGMLATAGAYAFNAAHCEIGSALLPRPGKRDCTFEELWRAVNVFEKRKGGRYIAAEVRTECVACGGSDPRGKYVSGQCWKCYNIRRKMAKGEFKVLSYDEADQRVKWNIVRQVFHNGRQQIFRVRWTTNDISWVTGDHQFLTRDGWKRTVELSAEDHVIYCPMKPDGPEWDHKYRAFGNYLQMKLHKTGSEVCEWCGRADITIEVAHLDGDHGNDNPWNLLWLCRSCHTKSEPRMPWSKGYAVAERTIVDVIRWDAEDVYTLEMDGEIGHNYVTGDLAINKNCVSYGMLAYWTMWLKRNHPVAFYVASLRKCGSDIKGKERQAQLLRDARKKGVKVGTLKLNRSQRSWSVDGDTIRPGFVQMHGIGDKMAERFLQAREELGRFGGWADLARIHGVGPAKIQAIKAFVNNPDPFELDLLSKTIAAVKQELFNGVEGDVPGSLLPSPSHRSIDVPYDRTDDNVPVVWLGVIRNRNLKDLFESHYSKTGEHLDPASQKDPHLKEWVVMLGEDETEPIVITVNRWQYPKFKDVVWSINEGRDLVLVRGVKYGFQARRAIYVHDLWVLQAN